MKIVLAEDSDTMRQLIANMLKTLGSHQVVAVGDGAQAWEQLRRGDVDLLLTDWNMPVMSGLELVEEVRRDERLGGLPILMSTSRKEKEDVLQAMRAGVNGYLAKPFTAVQLKEQLDKFVQRQESQTFRQVDEVFKGGRKLNLQDDFPFIVFAEKSVSPAKLRQAENGPVLNYLCAAVQALHRLNERHEYMDIGYILEDDPQELMRSTRLYHGRLKLLMVSTEVGGHGVTVARLTRLHKEEAFAVCLVAEKLTDFSAAERDSLEKLGILLLERRHINGEMLEWFFNEYAFARSREVNEEEDLPGAYVKQRLEQDMELMTSLPVLPQVYHKIMQLDVEKELSMSRWVETIEADPVSSALVLRRAHSPLYEDGEKADTVEKAVHLLGKEVVKQLVVYGNAQGAVGSERDVQFRVEDFWRHGMAVGRVAFLLSLPLEPGDWDDCMKKAFEELWRSQDFYKRLKSWDLERKLPLEADDDPFVGGLMHDLGKAALAQAYPGLWTAIDRRMQEAQWKIPVRVAEKEILGLDHTCVGEIMSRTWNLDPGLSRAIDLHHDAESDDPYAQLIALADFIGGAIQPYPRQAPFAPVLALTKYGNRQELAVNLPQEAEEEIAAFLPAGLLERLNLAVDELLEMALLLGPSVEKFTKQTAFTFSGQESRPRADNDVFAE